MPATFAIGANVVPPNGKRRTTWNRVANISKIQIKRLRQQGILTLAQLGGLWSDATVTGVRAETLAKLRAQAALQHKKRETGENQLELLPRDAHARTGFDRLPPPDEGDLFRHGG